MIRNLAIAAALSLSVSPLALAQSSPGSTMEIGQDVILATSIIGMPTFIKGEEATVGPIGRLVDAVVSLDGQIQGVVIRTGQGRAFAVPADRLEQGRVANRPVLLINISRQDAEQAPDVSQQLPEGQDMNQAAQTGDAEADGTDGGVTGTTIDGTNAAGNDEGSNGTGTEGRAGTDGEAMDSDGSSDGSSANGSTDGVTGTTIDGTSAAGNDNGSDGTGTEGRAGTDGEAMNGEAMDGEAMDGDSSGSSDASSGSGTQSN